MHVIILNGKSKAEKPTQNKKKNSVFFFLFPLEIFRLSKWYLIALTYQQGRKDVEMLFILRS